MLDYFNLNARGSKAKRSMAREFQESLLIPCPVCGFTQEDASFCNQCGASLHPESREGPAETDAGKRAAPFMRKQLDLSRRAHDDILTTQQEEAAQPQEELRDVGAPPAAAREEVIIVPSGRKPSLNAFKSREPGPPAAPPSRGLSLFSQLLIYLGVLVGVVFSSYVDKFKGGAPISLTITYSVFLIAAVVAFAIFPQVYEKLRLTPDVPLLVQFGLSVQNGIFWHVLFTAIGTAIGRSAVG